MYAQLSAGLKYAIHEDAFVEAASSREFRKLLALHGSAFVGLFTDVRFFGSAGITGRGLLQVQTS